mmetsp:Transcript_42311/g.109105  ORF Transcript_42311/g.109105 Transcript_42311/m.109105 type:complete len:261 (+) Transcript_42311:145-927(+)
MGMVRGILRGEFACGLRRHKAVEVQGAQHPLAPVGLQVSLRSRRRGGPRGPPRGRGHKRLRRCAALLPPRHERHPRRKCRLGGGGGRRRRRRVRGLEAPHGCGHEARGRGQLRLAGTVGAGVLRALGLLDGPPALAKAQIRAANKALAECSGKFDPELFQTALVGTAFDHLGEDVVHSKIQSHHLPMQPPVPAIANRPVRDDGDRAAATGGLQRVKAVETQLLDVEHRNLPIVPVPGIQPDGPAHGRRVARLRRIRAVAG